MCGILGELSLQAGSLRKEEFINLLDLSNQRGPDNQGYYSNSKNLQLGFNRLSILDLSALGNQPIHSLDKRMSMVYNGEIYNYQEIKFKLTKIGINVKSTGDSEVLVNSFRFIGLNETLQILDGMFAIGLFDHRLGLLHLIRDFAGIKPLHYGCNKDYVVFASQYDQIARHRGFKSNQINSKVLKLYLSQHYIPAPSGILNNTFQVEPGQIISFNKKGEKKSRRYWEFPETFDSKFFNYDSGIKHIDRVLNESVSAELVSDVPLCSFLSGGIDSALISYYASQGMNKPLSSISIGSDSIKHDESSSARIYGKLIGVKHTLKKMTANDARNLLEDVGNSMREPFADFSILPTFLVSKIAKEQATVALSGDGADELFFGYERFWSIAKNQHIQTWPYYIKYAIYGIDKILWNNKHINGISLFSSESEAHFKMHSRFSQKLISKIAPDLENVPFAQEDIYNYSKADNELDLLQKIRSAEFYGMMQKTLRKVDLASMANSLEVRVPFLKKSFIEASLLLDPYLSYGPNKGKISGKKVLLKKLLKSKLPNSPIDNSKKGFSVPLSNWIRGDLSKPLKDVLLDDSSIQYFGMKKRHIEKIFKDHCNTRYDHKWPIFTLFSLFNWNKNLSK